REMGVACGRDHGEMSDSMLDAFGRTQHGLLTRAQAQSVLSRRQVERRIADGRLIVVRRGVYRMAGSPETGLQQVLAACLAGGAGAYASFRCAAALWGLEQFPRDVVEITVRGDRRARLPGVVVHDSLVGGPRHLGRVHGVPVASVARTLCDLTAVVPA